MSRNSKTMWWTLSIATALTLATLGANATPPGDTSEVLNGERNAEPKAAPLPSVEEARGRARLLYETIQAMLQVVHHEYYREDEKLPIPARTFQKVFRELADNQKVEIRWLAVTGQAMNQDHADGGVPQVPCAEPDQPQEPRRWTGHRHANRVEVNSRQTITSKSESWSAAS